MATIRTIWADIRHGDNIDLYVVVVAAIVVAGLNAVGICNDEWLPGVTLATLGVVAAAILGNRHRIENLLGEIGSSRTPPLRMRADLTPLSSRAARATDILIVALSAAEVLRQTDVFVDRLRQGAYVRLALADPDIDSVLDAASLLTGIDREALLADMRSAKGLLDLIRQRAPDGTRLTVRRFDYAPTLSLVMIDADKPTGQIVVEMRPYGKSGPSRCHLLVTAKDHPTWYTYFHDICESIWQNAHSWEA
jgi:hypothetical protein